LERSTNRHIYVPPTRPYDKGKSPEEKDMKVKQLREAIAELDDDVELAIRSVQSFVIEPVENKNESNITEGGEI